MSTTDSTPPAPPGVVLEARRRLSESLLWRLQRRFYDDRGTKAWSSEGLPFHITSNAFIARAYARVVLGFLRDCSAADPSLLDRSRPVYILELAAGSGHFGYLFLKRLLGLKRALPLLGGLDLRYVMTDLAEANLRAWSEHERFRPFLSEGILDFAVFDVESTRELKLLRTGEVLSPGAGANPLAVFANYTFDSTVQDAFWVKGGQLHEGLVTLLSSQEEPDLSDPQLLQRITLRYEPRPVGDRYYEDPALERILRGYGDRLGDTAFLIPVGALRCLRSLMDLSGGRLLLLSADKGVTREDEIEGRAEPERVVHGGCFSMPVNYHAIGQYFRELGGVALSTSQTDQHLKVCAGLLGGPPAAFAESQLAFQEAIEGFGPFEYHHLVKGIRKDEATIELILALLKLSDWDYKIVYDFSDALARQAEAAPEPMKRELKRCLERTWEHFFPVDRDAAFVIGRIMAVMRQYMDALRYYKESLRLFGPHHATYFQMAMCLYMLQQPEASLQYLDRALAIKPGFGSARQWRNRLQAEMKGE